MSKVGSTVNGRYSTGLQQKRFKSFSCLFVVIIQSGSGATLTSRIKAVDGFEAWLLHSERRRYQGSSVPPCRERFFLSFSFNVFLVKSFTCCRFRGTCPTLMQPSIPPKSSETVLYRTSRGFACVQLFCTRDFVLDQVRTYCWDVFAFPCECCLIGCSIPPLNEYWTKQYLHSSPSGTT